MLIRYLDEKKNTKTFIEFICDVCEEKYTRITRSYTNMQKNSLYDQDYCVKCWRKRINNSPQYKINMSKAIQKMLIENPDFGQNVSRGLRKSGANIGDKNGMKQLEARQKVSRARKIMFQDSKVRAHYSKKVREAWARGDFDGVRVGQCKWHDYLHSDGEIYKVQGTWELAFIEWIDKNNLEFKCHRGRIPYVLNGVDKNFYPDFWINKWDSYVDVKCPHFYVKEKFDAIRESNPDIEVKVLFKDDLVKLGVNL